MAVVSIQYKEGAKKNLAYKSVEISYAGLKKRKIFKSGDFVKDWYDCNKFIITEMSDGEPICNSSTVDHFIMDGAPYRSAYLYANEKNSKLVYEYDHKNPGIEFFVKEGTKPTWLELRVLCGDPPKNKK